MKPASKAQIKGKRREVILAKNQKPYLPLPVAVWDDNLSQFTLTSRWKFSFVERLRVLIFGNLFLSMLTFGEKPMPISLSTEEPEWLLS